MLLLEEKIKALPPKLQEEVIDFIDFLSNKYSNSKIKVIRKSKSVAGSLEKYKNNNLQKKEKTAWATFAALKHENR